MAEGVSAGPYLGGFPVVSGYQGKLSSAEKSRTMKSAPCSRFRRKRLQKARLLSSFSIGEIEAWVSRVKPAFWARLMARLLCTLARFVLPSIDISLGSVI